MKVIFAPEALAEFEEADGRAVFSWKSQFDSLPAICAVVIAGKPAPTGLCRFIQDEK
ncbi:MAG: hypothetical protein Q8Q28_00970 [Pseudomonadota bacterium]|nr:hypothetical protein [Pseudomonadota bacterium]